MTSKTKGLGLMLLAVPLCGMLAGTVMAATAGQRTPAPPPAPPAPAVAAPAWTPEPPEPPEPDEEFIFIEDGRAWLGVTLSEVTADKARELRLSGEYGAVVESVVEESPAAKAGLEKGDVITGVVGERVRSVAQLRRLVRETPTGRKVSLEVVRGGQSRTLEVALETRRMHFTVPEVYAQVPEVHVVPRVEVGPRFEIEAMPDVMTFGRGPRLGVMTDEISGQLAEYFGVKQGQGVLVKEVIEGSAAAKAGLKAGDVIIRLNDETINEVGDLRRALNRAESREVTVTVVRDRREQTLKVTLDEPQPRVRRRTAQAVEEIERRAAQMAQAMQARAAEMERHIRENLESQHLQQQLQDAARQAEGQVRQMQERFQSEELQQRMQQLQKEIQGKQMQLQSEEFQKRMRELERRVRELQREQNVI
jgi:membrane-associated protease RseP (regulator of RpoE activity)